MRAIIWILLSIALINSASAVEVNERDETCMKTGIICMIRCKDEVSCENICKGDLSYCKAGVSGQMRSSAFNEVEMRDLKQAERQKKLQAEKDNKAPPAGASPTKKTELPPWPKGSTAPFGIGKNAPGLVPWEKGAIEKAMRAAMPPNADCRRKDLLVSTCQFRTGGLDMFYQFAPDGPGTFVVTGYVHATNQDEYNQYRLLLFSFITSLSGINTQSIDSCYAEAENGMARGEINPNREMTANDRTVVCETSNNFGTINGINTEIRAVNRF